MKARPEAQWKRLAEEIRGQCDGARIRVRTPLRRPGEITRVVFADFALDSPGTPL